MILHDVKLLLMQNMSPLPSSIAHELGEGAGPGYRSVTQGLNITFLPVCASLW